MLRDRIVGVLLTHRINVLTRMQELERVRRRDLIHAARYEMAAWYRDVQEGIGVWNDGDRGSDHALPGY